MDKRKRKKIENLDIIKQIYYNLSDRIIFEKVKGHTGKQDWNSKVDTLAVEAKKRKGMEKEYHVVKTVTTVILKRLVLVLNLKMID